MESAQTTGRFLQSLLDHLPVFIYRRDAEGRLTFANRNYCERRGKPLAALLGKTDFDLSPPTEAQQHWDDNLAVMRTRRPIEADEEQTLADGKKRWIHIVKVPIVDDHDQVIGTQGMYWDVTEHRQTEAALAQERELLHALLENVDDNIYFKDRDSRFITVSRILARKFGVNDPAKVTGKTDFDFFDEEHARQAFADEQEILRSGQPMIARIEKETWTGGPETWGLTTKVPLRNGAGEIIGTCGITKDITDIIRAEDRLRKLSQAVEQSPVSIIITDLSGKIEYTNPKFSEMTGYTAAEVIGAKPSILKSDETPPEEYRRLWETITAGGTWQGEFHNRRKNGGLFWESATISPIRNAAGEPTHYLAVKEDITARKLAETELKAAKIAAEAAARAKSEFLANMSHEIRTPMNGVIGMTGLLLDTSLDPEQRQYAESVRNSADNLMTVINDILDFSKIEAGKLVFEELDFNLVETVEGTLDMLAERAQSKGIELIDTIAPEVPTRLRGDPGRLRQILTNLLGNALKFTTHGEVVLRVALARETATHALVRFTVTDTGIGIPRHVQERLFQSFQQADSSTTRKYGGTGLGLAISKQLANLMHGEIGVESEVGQGATFWFTAEFEKLSGNLPPPPDDSRDLFNLRVLVVDDNATNRQILRHQIFAWKMQKGSAASGSEALEAMRAAATAGQPYDIALLDMQMPEMDGLTLAHAIKADPALAPTRLIMLTSLGHRFSKAELQAAGIDAYLIKPVKQSRLFDTLVTVVGGAKVERKLTETAPPVATADQPALRVLVAEDNATNQKVAMAQLKKLGCTVDIASNWLEALDAVSRLPYDLIFMDCQMPEMDGYEATRTLRKQEQDTSHPCRWTAPVYIIAMTANAMLGDREKCLAVGMDDYVSKPMRLSELQTAMNRWRGVLQSRSGTPAQA